MTTTKATAEAHGESQVIRAEGDATAADMAALERYAALCDELSGRFDCQDPDEGTGHPGPIGCISCDLSNLATMLRAVRGRGTLTVIR